MGDTKNRYIEYLEEKHSKEKMMEIIDAKIDWKLGWNNSPELQILVDKIPRTSSSSSNSTRASRASSIASAARKLRRWPRVSS